MTVNFTLPLIQTSPSLLLGGGRDDTLIGNASTSLVHQRMKQVTLPVALGQFLDGVEVPPSPCNPCPSLTKSFLTLSPTLELGLS